LAQDRKKWFAEYKEYAAEDGIGKLKFWPWPCSTSLAAMICWWISHNFPSVKARRRLLDYTMWIEPYLTKYPARYGRKRIFSRGGDKQDNAVV
jgi:hypothetical protein